MCVCAEKQEADAEMSKAACLVDGGEDERSVSTPSEDKQERKHGTEGVREKTSANVCTRQHTSDDVTSECHVTKPKSKASTH